MRVKLYVDTNIFIHFKDLDQVKWEDSPIDCRNLEIVVPMDVVRELEKHKNSDRRRLRDRSRKAVKNILKIMDSKNKSISVKVNGLNIEIPISVNSTIKDETFTENLLDKNIIDDRIIAKVKEDEGASLLTDDIALNIRARGLGITAYEIPESWKLPDEKTKEEKRLEQALHRLQNIEKNYPKIDVYCDSNEIIIQHFCPPPLRREQIKNIAENIFKQNPKATKYHSIVNEFGIMDFSTTPLPHDYTREEFDKYNEKYYDYIDKTYEFLGRISEIIRNRKTVGFIEIFFSNLGLSSAKNLIVKLNCERLSVNEECFYRDIDWDMPKPPYIRPAHDNVPFSLDKSIPTKYIRDKSNEFRINEKYYDDKSTKLEYICEDFRPKQTKNVNVLVDRCDFNIKDDKIRILFSATNFAEEMREYSVKIEETYCDWSNENLLRSLPYDLSSSIRECLGV